MAQTQRHSSARRGTRRVRKSAPRQGLKPVEKTQVKEIAKKLDDKGKQVCEKLFQTPGTNESGSAYTNYAFPGMPGSGDDLMDIMPDIAQAGTSGQEAASRERRLGSKIKLSSLKTNFMFHIPPATTPSNDTNSVQCRLLILSSKTLKKFSLLKQEWVAGTQNLARRYLRDGDAETFFQGDLNSLRFPVNTALFTTHYDKRFILNRGLRLGSTDSGCVVPDAIRTLNFNLKVKSKYLRFPDTALSENEDFAPFAILIYAPTNGGHTTTDPTDNVNCVNGKCFVHCTWKNLM